MTNSSPDRAKVFSKAQPIIEEFESFRDKAYLCPAKVWTIGYGTTVYPDGSHVKEGDTCTKQQAIQWLQFLMGQMLDFMEKKISYPCSVEEMAAMLSLVYNIGTGAWANSTLLRKFNMGDLSGAASAFLSWDKATVNGVLTELPGLKRRREAEKALFDTRKVT